MRWPTLENKEQARPQVITFEVWMAEEYEGGFSEYRLFKEVI